MNESRFNKRKLSLEKNIGIGIDSDSDSDSSYNSFVCNEKSKVFLGLMKSEIKY